MNREDKKFPGDASRSRVGASSHAQGRPAPPSALQTKRAAGTQPGGRTAAPRPHSHPPNGPRPPAPAGQNARHAPARQQNARPTVAQPKAGPQTPQAWPRTAVGTPVRPTAGAPKNPSPAGGATPRPGAAPRAGRPAAPPQATNAPFNPGQARKVAQPKAAVGTTAGQPAARTRPGAPASRGHANAAGTKGAQARPASARPVIQRLVRVQNIDYNPLTGNFLSSNFDVRNILRELQATNFWARLNGGEQTNMRNLANVGGANVTGNDVPTLATGLIAHVTGGGGGRVGALTPHARELEHALGRAAEREVSDREETAFNTLHNLCRVKSRAKGVPNEVRFQDLPVRARTSLQSLIKQLRKAHNILNQIPLYIRNVVDSGGRASNQFTTVRSPHENRAGWLPQPAVVTREAALNLAVANYITPLMWASLSGNARAKIRAITGGTYNNAPATAIEDYCFFTLADRQNYFNNIFAPTVPTKQDRLRLAWDRYVRSCNLNNCPFIEFAAENAGGVSRFIYDFVQDRFYASVHYNWVNGFNPFIWIRNTPPTQ